MKKETKKKVIGFITGAIAAGATILSGTMTVKSAGVEDNNKKQAVQGAHQGQEKNGKQPVYDKGGKYIGHFVIVKKGNQTFYRTARLEYVEIKLQKNGNQHVENKWIVK